MFTTIEKTIKIFFLLLLKFIKDIIVIRRRPLCFFVSNRIIMEKDKLISLRCIYTFIVKRVCAVYCVYTNIEVYYFLVYVRQKNKRKGNKKTKACTPLSLSLSQTI